MSSNEDVISKLIRALKVEEEEMPKRRKRSEEMLKKERVSTLHVTITPSEKAVLLKEFQKRKHLRTVADLVRNIIHEWRCMKTVLGDVMTLNMKMDQLMKKIDEMNSKMDQLIRYLKELTEEKEVVEVTATAR